jgi:hypothetical protein
MKTLCLSFSVITILCLGCNTLKTTEIIGCYEGETLGIYTYLALKSDSTYIINTSGDLFEVSQKGIWKVRRNSILLNSTDQPNTVGYFKAKYNNAIKGQIRFYLFELKDSIRENIEDVYIKQGEKYYKLHLINNNTFAIDCNIIDLKKSFIVRTCGIYNEIEIKPNNTDANEFELFLVKNYNGFFQTNEKYKVKQDRVIKKYRVIKELYVLNKTKCIE